jgi:hypothetical protein
MKEKLVTLPSKAVLKIQMAPWEDAHNLYKAVMGVVSKTSFEHDGVINFLAKVSISTEIETALWACYGRAHYNGQKINKELFENEEVRGDYLIIAKEVLAYNMAPFLASLVSVLSQASGLKNILIPESK